MKGEEGGDKEKHKRVRKKNRRAGEKRRIKRGGEVIKKGMDDKMKEIE